jgi:hypothetical protein
LKFEGKDLRFFWRSGLRFTVKGLRFTVLFSGFRASGLGYRVQGTEFRDAGFLGSFGSRVWGLGRRV